MFIVPVLFAAVVFWMIARTGVARVPARGGHLDEALEIVRQRFARGEIDAAEYTRLVSGLTGTR